ncbi:MAG TPA: hypothetical protein VFG64_08180 [Dongiaceae bacterium]|nr:hypothetical protein [Dongiaceae bacterium]
MLRFVTTRSHQYTMRALRPALGRSRIAVWHYDRLFRQRGLPGGTWIFTDHERLDPYELRLAAEIARLLRAAGIRVLNNPARVRCRVDLLRALHRAGINSFSAWRADEAPRPDRFPVFVRAESDHLLPHSGLLHSQQELDAALEDLKARGEPLRGLAVITYEAEQIRAGMWRKYSTFRVGGQVFTHHTVVDYQWVVKMGDLKRLRKEPALAELTAEEHGFVRDNPHADVLMRAFEVAGIEFGRADFGLVGGRPQIYEINTNPMLGLTDRGAMPLREETLRIGKQRLLSAVGALVQPDEGRVRLDSPELAPHQGWRGWLVRSRPKP